MFKRFQNDIVKINVIRMNKIFKKFLWMSVFQVQAI